MSDQIIRQLWDFRQSEIPEKLLELKVSQAAVEARLAAAAERYLPELAPDFVQVRRLAVLDGGGNLFR